MCCGNKRTQMRLEAEQAVAAKNAQMPNAVAAQTAVPFVNTMSTGMTVIGPVSGKQYHFAHSGAQVMIDPRDRALLAKLRQLRAR
jgi:hypothetical protein